MGLQGTTHTGCVIRKTTLK